MGMSLWMGWAMLGWAGWVCRVGSGECLCVMSGWVAWAVVRICMRGRMGCGEERTGEGMGEDGLGAVPTQCPPSAQRSAQPVPNVVPNHKNWVFRMCALKNKENYDSL